MTHGATGVYSFVPPYIERVVLEHYEKAPTSAPQSIQTSEHGTRSYAQLQKISIEFVIQGRQARYAAYAARVFSGPPMIPPSSSSGISGGTPPPTKASSSVATSPKEVWDARSQRRVLSSSMTSLRTTDVAALSCYKNLGEVDEFYRRVFQKPPVDNTTKLMKAFVHDPNAFNNAFWMPSTESIYYGEVDPQFFKPLVGNLDICVHEYGHAVTHYTSRLAYVDQSGALNESISDVFATIAKQDSLKQKADDADANWLVGEVVVGGGALRSMSNPGSAYNHPIMGIDPQPAHMNEYKKMTEDNGGVHLNSGIPNRAFYLAAKNIGGSSATAGEIWFKTLIASGRTDNFSDFAIRSISIAQSLRGDNVANIVGKAWKDVGVDLRKPVVALPQTSNPDLSNHIFSYPCCCGCLTLGAFLAIIMARKK